MFINRSDRVLRKLSHSTYLAIRPYDLMVDNVLRTGQYNDTVTCNLKLIL